MEKDVLLVCVIGFVVPLLGIRIFCWRFDSIRKNRALAWLMVVSFCLTTLLFSYIIITAEANTPNPVFTKIAIIILIFSFPIFLSLDSIKTIREKKLFYYNDIGYRYYFYKNNRGGVISEVRFPRTRKGVCIGTLLRTNDISEGQTVDLLFGDPRKLEKCTLISKNAQDAPKTMQEDEKERGHDIWKFKYKGKYFWTCEFTYMKVV